MLVCRTLVTGTIASLLAMQGMCVAQLPTTSQTPTSPLETLQTQIVSQAQQIEELKKQLDNKIDRDAPSFGNFVAEYQNGFLLRPIAPKPHPFELKVNGWTQFRHHAFDRDVTTWTDNAGFTRPVENRSAFDIERARLVLSGHAVDERLTYFVQLDGDTDGAHAVDFFDYWWGWQLTDSFQLQMGKRKVSASRQWLLGARHTRFVERPMANDFFRPDRTVGIWGVGKIGGHGQYELMLGNGYSTANLPNSVTDNRFTYAATNYFDPWGDYGNPIVDFERSSEPLLRVGHSFVYSPHDAN